MKNCYKQEKNKHRETKLAYVDIAPKAPRDVRNAQVKKWKLRHLLENLVHRHL